jgi:deferrochelatase/peroxidase EfeB
MGPLSNADFKDMQGLLRFGYSSLTAACFLLLRIDDVAAASAWLSHVPVSTAEIQTPPPSRSLQIAITCQGLHRLGVPNDILNGFSVEFLGGMVGDDNRSRRLGDVAANAPEQWQWGGYDSIPDLMVMLYATPDQFEEWKAQSESELCHSGFTLLRSLSTSNMDGIEPFGFADGISAPVIDWERRRNPSGDKLRYENVVMLGEFVLGYPNEYGKYTTRPTVSDASADLPTAEDLPDLKDVGRNGTYLVMRQIEQDVRGFWQFLDRHTNGDSERQNLAEHLVGRRMSGEPLVDLASTDIPGIGPDPTDLQQNRFTFDSDPDGVSCPLGAHIRRANPRNADLPFGTSSGLVDRLLHTLALNRLISKKPARRDLLASTRFHRLLRRGREYGPNIPPDQRLQPAPSDEPPTGLHFICLNANIGRQFEFVQSAWIMSDKFDGLNDESDPLLGNREQVAGCPTNIFSLPAPTGVRQQLLDIPRVTTIRGGAYFFLPGLRALRYLAGAGRV